MSKTRIHFSFFFPHIKCLEQKKRCIALRALSFSLFHPTRKGGYKISIPISVVREETRSTDRQKVFTLVVCLSISSRLVWLPTSPNKTVRFQTKLKYSRICKYGAAHFIFFLFFCFRWIYFRRIELRWKREKTICKTEKERQLLFFLTGERSFKVIFVLFSASVPIFK